ncbi:hypothetical protein ACRAWF_44710 [Streptomyces sp. L7]
MTGAVSRDEQARPTTRVRETRELMPRPRIVLPGVPGCRVQVVVARPGGVTTVSAIDLGDRQPAGSVL